ncbi:hypothetical protein BDV98DRAFT_577020, partial [Pterulicium gracile]
IQGRAPYDMASLTGSIIQLFPVSTFLSGPLCSTPLPGASPASTKAMRQVLVDNRKRWHAFFHVRGFYKYIFSPYPRTLGLRCIPHLESRQLMRRTRRGRGLYTL